MNPITDPGVVVAALQNPPILSCATGTVTAHRGSLLPAAQLLPAVADVTVLASRWLSVSGLCTVTENVTVAVSPGFRLPAQVRSGLA